MRPESAELERLHGSVLRHIAADNTSEYKIVLKLRTLEPPVFTTRAAVELGAALGDEMRSVSPDMKGTSTLECALSQAP